MRIFVAVRHAADPTQFYGGLWSGNFYPALWRLGNEIVESQVDLQPASAFMGEPGPFGQEQARTRGEITQRIVDEVKAAHAERPLDLVLTYFYNSHFDPTGFEEFDRLGIPTVNFYCNSIYQFELVAAVAAKVRFSWHAEKHARDRYLGVGANPVWVRMGADPDVYKPVQVAAREPKAVFVGQKYADRDRLVAAMLRAAVPVDVYGSGWGGPPSPPAAPPPSGSPGSRRAYLGAIAENVRRLGPVGGLVRSWRQFQYRRESRRLTPVLAPAARGFAPDVAETFSRYEICMNFSNVWADGRPAGRLISHVRLRDFEGPMCRTCFLTGHTDEIKEFYRIGVEIDTYRTPDDLIDKTRYYLAHADRAEAMREAGYRRALRDHTWDRRFEQLFREIGLSK